MNKIGRKIYFDKTTGNPIMDMGEMQGFVMSTTVEQDRTTFSVLAERSPETFDVLELPFGAYAKEFATCTGYRVNPDRKVIDFIFDGKEANELEDLKAIKIANLKRLCEATIEEGFTSKVNGHHYRTNRDDQANFMGRKEELNDFPNITTVKWKTEDVGYIDHTREDWIKIFYEGIRHKEYQLFKYDELKKAVLLAEDASEVDSIN